MVVEPTNSVWTNSAGVLQMQGHQGMCCKEARVEWWCCNTEVLMSPTRTRQQKESYAVTRPVDACANSEAWLNLPMLEEDRITLNFFYFFCGENNSEFVCHIWNMSFSRFLVIHLTKYLDANEIFNKVKISLPYFSWCSEYFYRGCNAFTIWIIMSIKLLHASGCQISL